MEPICTTAAYNVLPTKPSNSDGTLAVRWNAAEGDDRTYFHQVAAPGEDRFSRACDQSLCSQSRMAEKLLSTLSMAGPPTKEEARNTLRKVQSSSPRRFNKPSFNLPFTTDIPSFRAFPELDDTEHAVQTESTTARRFETAHPYPKHANSWPSIVSIGKPPSSTAITPPLTPPEKDPFTWEPVIPADFHAQGRQASVSAGDESARTDVPSMLSSDRSSDRPSTIILPSSNVFEQQGPSTWLDRALQKMHSMTELQKTCSELQVVVQAMPSHASRLSTAPRQSFEEIVARIQRLARVPYVRITHAYTKRYDVSLKDAPISPPATPNVVGGQDYFDDWTICTNLARIPDYHSGPIQDEHRNPRVAAPNRIHASTLERYLPPTTPQEVHDFFSLSRRSYLADRLNELHDGSDGPSGALMLVYPTLSGGRTFKTYYKDPVLDPLLRRFMMLFGLTTRAGEALGKMDAIDSLMSFEDMQSAIEALCRQLGRYVPPSGRISQFVIEHAEQTEVVLDRETWIEQFLAQESSRMRQDLVDYQKSGQRMPAQGFEASPAALAREVEDGIRSSTEAAGEVAIEVGVFVIRRSML